MAEKRGRILDAIDAAMEAEREANAFYARSAKKASSERGRDLLKQLAAFEQTHFDRLAELKASLTDEGRFLVYVGTDFASITSEVPTETDAGNESNLDEVMTILDRAIEAETKAHQRYRALAAETDSPEGKEMFLRLAQEEMNHRRILSDEVYHLANKGGIWQWGD